MLIVYSLKNIDRLLFPVLTSLRCKVEVNPEHTGQSGETEEEVIQKSSRGDISVKLPVKEGEGNQRKFISSGVEKSKPKWQACKKKAE